MSGDILIRREGRAGRITLNRPGALNALTWEMCLEIDAALKDWAADDSVALVLIDGAGERAFCAGGDIAEMYRTGAQGDYDYGRRFWADEYRMNARMAEFAKPVVSFLHGFTMGGGVGVGCHGAHRLVDESAKIAMPECGIGLVPDVGGSLLLSRAPGRLGEYLGLTGARMRAGDAIHAGFADRFVPGEAWTGLKAELCLTGDVGAIAAAADTPPESALAARQAEIDALFADTTLDAIVNALRGAETEFAREALAAVERNAPLSMGCTLEMLRRLRPGATIRDALAQEYRVTYRAMEHGDFLEGIRAAIIDKDKTPRWRHALDGLAAEDVERMLAPLGEAALDFGEEENP
ncbi:enoyl-CoA hydratase/isomerase family protein [Rhodosalinus sp.]|uniref:enoyl-CoA hydratase/isomerase family protein n=1 Tax=Rhodosalinus sp. TaxID=2047741 RepID=UPI0035675BA3